LWQQKLRQRKPDETEKHLEPIAVFIQRVTAAVSELKDDLQQDYERTYPDLGEIIRIVLDEEEAKAWELSFFPHLFLPDMVEVHIARLGLQPAHARHNNVLAPPDLTKIKNHQLSPAYAADCHQMLATSPT
jgi:hypothetical protein